MRLDFMRFVRDEEGQDLTEYALLAALIAVVAIVAVTRVGTATAALFDGVAAKLEAAL